MASMADEYLWRLADPAVDLRGLLPRLLAETLSRPHAVVVELGVRSGNSTAAFLHGVEQVDGELFSVDIEAPAVPDWWWGHPRWRFHLGDDLWPAARAFAPATYDVVFIDTVHTLGHTLAELDVWAPGVVGGGVVLLHDIELPRSIEPADPEYPVAAAVERWLGANPGWDYEAVSGWYGLGVLTRNR